ncbi:MAG TPA: hypothetical protein VE956_06095 [Nodularia sp. (in: cyanobacteria)]|nr:hypothetical protein [Nodularia sp. (in: cyanobacteria)]
MEYRRRQREDRERKRQESLEQDAAYAARMQSQYGVEQRGRGADGKISASISSSPLHPCPHAFFIAVHTPNEIDGDNNRGGMGTEAELSDSWWERVKYYARLAIERFESGVESVKELLSTLTIDERWGVIFKFEDIDPQKFAQLVADAPDWVEWMA